MSLQQWRTSPDRLSPAREYNRRSFPPAGLCIWHMRHRRHSETRRARPQRPSVWLMQLVQTQVGISFSFHSSDLRIEIEFERNLNPIVVRVESITKIRAAAPLQFGAIQDVFGRRMQQVRAPILAAMERRW